MIFKNRKRLTQNVNTYTRGNQKNKTKAQIHTHTHTHTHTHRRYTHTQEDTTISCNYLLYSFHSFIHISFYIIESLLHGA